MNYQENPLSEEDFEMVYDALPVGVVHTLFAFPQLMLAGGFIRAVLAGEEPKDIDIFTTDLSVVEQAVQFYIRQCERWECVMEETETPCTITVTGGRYPVQFINNVAYESPEECIQKFDFTICQAVIYHDLNGWQSRCSPSFHQDVARKRLVYTAPDRVEAPGGSLWRAIKFVQKGYSITQAELVKLIIRMNQGLSCVEIVTDPEIISKSFAMPGSGGTY